MTIPRKNLVSNAINMWLLLRILPSKGVPKYSFTEIPGSPYSVTNTEEYKYLMKAIRKQNDLSEKLNDNLHTVG